MNIKNTLITLSISALLLSACNSSTKKENISPIGNDINVTLYKDYKNVFQINIKKTNNLKQDLTLKSNDSKILLLSSSHQGEYEIICMPIATANNISKLDCSGYYPNENQERDYKTYYPNIANDTNYSIEQDNTLLYYFDYSDGRMNITSIKSL